MEGNTEHETAARHLWLDVLREAEKDNRYHKTTDFAGAFRQFDNFYLWLCLHKYVPGMKVYRYSGDYLWTVAAYNAGGHNLRRATGYKKGMNFEIVKTARPAAYALARTVQRMEARYGRKR